MMDESLNYFAYGSNLHPARLQARIGACHVRDVALLAGASLCFHKVGLDRSGKCDISFQQQTATGVWGVIYQISPEQRGQLDQFESLGAGYQIREVEVLTRDRQTLKVFTYHAMSEFIDAQIQPFDWYHELVLQGARFHGFPAEYLEQLLQVELATDSDSNRISQAQQIMQSMRDFSVDKTGERR